MAASTLKIAKNELNSIPYFTGLIKMDCVRFEPTTSAQQLESSFVYTISIYTKLF
jgi:hypothetical protein